MTVRSRPLPLITVAVLAVGGLIAGCGSSSKKDSSSSSSSSPATTAAAAPATAAKTTSGGLTVDASEFTFAPPTLSAKAGKVKVTLDNKGQTQHEFVLLKTSTAADKLKVTGGRVSEKDSVGEISETDGGKSASHTFDLEPGTYVYVCNIPGHYMQGMRGTLTVR